MSFTFGLSGMFGGLKAAGRKSALSNVLSDAANRAMPFITETAGDLKKWGEQDWEHFKETYRPVADALVDDANKEPDYGRQEREVSLAAARGLSGDNAAIRSEASRSGAGVGSGRFGASTLRAASSNAAGAGVGQVMGRLKAEDIATNKKLSVIGSGKPDPSSAIAGLGIVTKGGANYGKYSAAIGRSTGDSLGGAAKGFGQAVGSWNPSSEPTTTNLTTNPSSEAGEWEQGDTGQYNGGDGGTYGGGGDYGDAPSYATGGLIRGPGTGRSDSIPAVIDGQRPARVSNGEYHVAGNVVARIGKPRLESLIAISRG